MAVPVTGATAGILGIIYSCLCFSVGLTRLRTQILYGTSSKPDQQYLVHYVRAQENMAEYVPLGLILLACAEFNGALSSGPLRIVAAIFTVARISHALQLRHPKHVPVRLRQGGFLVSLAVFLYLGIVNLRAVV